MPAGDLGHDATRCADHAALRGSALRHEHSRECPSRRESLLPARNDRLATHGSADLLEEPRGYGDSVRLRLPAISRAARGLDSPSEGIPGQRAAGDETQYGILVAEPGREFTISIRRGAEMNVI